MGSNEANLEAVRAYHHGTKHGPHGFAPGPGFMDWANQPDPFRRYAGADLLPLPLQAGPADLDFAALDAAGSIAPSGLDAESLSLFLELSMGLTAWKAYQDTSWALRANPSSGNLHPTELTLVAPPSMVWPVGPAFTITRPVTMGSSDCRRRPPHPSPR